MTDARNFDLELDMLSGYLDGELAEGERAAVEARLSESAEWRAELAEVQSARAIVRALNERAAPEGFWDQVVENVGADGDAASTVDHEEAVAPAIPLPAPSAGSTRRGARVSSRARATRWLAGAAAAVVALVVVVALPHESAVKPNVTAVATQHVASSSETGGPISGLAGIGPMVGFRR